jgi:hypothetical protein
MFNGQQKFMHYSQVNEHIAELLVEAIGEDGPLLVVVDRQGNSWSSDTLKFTQVLSEEMIEQITCRIDDGCDPVISSCDEVSFYATELMSDQFSCGFLIIAFSGTKEVDILDNIAIIEGIGSLANVVASLIRRQSFAASYWPGEGNVESDARETVILN